MKRTSTQQGGTRRTELVDGRDVGLETLALPDVEDELLNLATLLGGLSGHNLPVVEHHLGEGLTGGRLAKLAGETERLGNGEVRADGVHGRSGTLLLGEDVTTLPVESRVDTSKSLV